MSQLHFFGPSIKTSKVFDSQILLAQHLQLRMMLVLRYSSTSRCRKSGKTRPLMENFFCAQLKNISLPPRNLVPGCSWPKYHVGKRQGTLCSGFQILERVDTVAGGRRDRVFHEELSPLQGNLTSDRSFLVWILEPNFPSVCGRQFRRKLKVLGHLSIS